jgi:hypothetical protein
MQGSIHAFYRRQSAKMAEYAASCTDPALKDTLLRMSVSWLAMALPPSGDHEQPIKATLSAQMPKG